MENEIKEKLDKVINEVKVNTDSSNVLLFCSDDNSFSSKLKDMYKDDENVKVMTLPTKYLGDDKEDIDTKIFVIPNMDKPKYIRYNFYDDEEIEAALSIRED